MAPTPRLSAADLFNLAAETPDTPMHIGALAVLDGDPPPLAAVRTVLERGVAGVPRLRQVVRGRVWADDADFRIDRHLSRVALPAPADEDALLHLTERLLAPPLDRAHPLWRMWLVTGLPGHRFALVVALHHAIADGLAAVDLIMALLGAPSSPAPVLRRGRGSWRGVFSAFGRVSPTSLNRPTGPRRTLATLRLDLADAKRVAHAHGGKVNDLLLGLVTGGVRALLESRGESVDRVRVRASVAVSRRAGPTAELGNQVGSLLIRLPVDAPDPASRTRAIAARTREAKRVSPAGAGLAMQALLVRLGLVRRFIRRQRMITFIESDLAGPPAPMELLGARVLDLVPFTALAGNLTVAFVAMSYAGRITLTVHADADALPDLAVLTEAMTLDWTALR